MSKILIVNKNLNPGGAEHQLVNIANILIAEDHEVNFLLFDKTGTLLSRTSAAIDVIPQEYNSTFKRVCFLREYILTNKFNSVVSFLPECNLINCLSSLPSRKWRVITGARSANPSFKTSFWLKIYYYIHLLADAVISNSETNIKDIISVAPFVKRDKLNVIYNILEPKYIEQRYTPFKNNQINLVVAANYREVKNLFGLLNALMLLSAEDRARIHINWYGLQIDNSFVDAQKFIEVNDLQETITLNNSVSNVNQVYEEADVVGLFSKFEGLPNSLCEALIQGKTVITTPVSDLPVLLKGTDNFVCENYSAEAIAETLKKMIATTKDKIIQCGVLNKEKYSSVFDPMEIQKELLSTIIPNR